MMPFSSVQSGSQGVGDSHLFAYGLNLSGRILVVYVRLESGMTDTNDIVRHPAGATLAAKFGPDCLYGDAGWPELARGEGSRLELNVDQTTLDSDKEPTFYDVSDIHGITLEIDTNPSASTVGTPDVVWLEHFCYC